MAAGGRIAIALEKADPQTLERLTAGGHRMSDWEGSPAEDFAEAIAAFWSGEQWDIRTDGGPLTPEVEAFLDRLTTSNT